LLKVPGFAYQGTVPAVMCYPRQPILADEAQNGSGEADEVEGSETSGAVAEPQPEPALV
jgi:hypothetical protein